VIVLGFLLGMRHATDADHVIAVSTIVSRQRSAWGAALIGSLWGIGHTVTIMVVGGVIILFDLVIPPRLGLAMEFSVGRDADPPRHRQPVRLHDAGDDGADRERSP
jgi:high-affinity nickel-transport protein